MGELSDEMYNFLMGLPTQHAGSWVPGKTAADDGSLLCGNTACKALPILWQALATKGSVWTEMQPMECAVCQDHRNRRNRLVEPDDARLREPDFVRAPFVHQNNEPKYHAMLMRSVELAKHGYESPRHILWITAQDTPHNPKEISDDPAQIRKKMDRFLQFNDQKTSGIPGIHKSQYFSCS